MEHFYMCTIYSALNFISAGLSIWEVRSGSSGSWFSFISYILIAVWAQIFARDIQQRKLHQTTLINSNFIDCVQEQIHSAYATLSFEMSSQVGSPSNPNVPGQTYENTPTYQPFQNPTALSKEEYSLNPFAQEESRSKTPSPPPPPYAELNANKPKHV